MHFKHLTPPGTTESALKDMKAPVLDHRWTIEICNLSGFRDLDPGVTDEQVHAFFDAASHFTAHQMPGMTAKPVPGIW